MGRPKPKKRNRRRIGARSYKNYSEEMLTLAVEMVRNKNISSYDAEKQFGIPRRTIEKRAKNLHTDKPGPRYRFSKEEELKFVKVLTVASEFGCPLTQLDFRLVVFDYLKKNNKSYIFNDNPPGDWWVKNFLMRHHDKLTERSTQNIKKARADKSLQDFQIYFENLKSSVENLPATHILNYDETNVSDDPGSVKCIFRRGVKYPERLVNYSKGSISIMFSGTANGDLLDPYVVYKSEHMWTQWCNGGPAGARYNRTKSGWFDSTTFVDWFTTIILPWARRLKGPKLVIGDNLSSHINLDVVELCESHNIKFVLLPPNTTHLTQPLDVAFFAPLKRTWRKILMQYKIENPKQTSLNKSHFPLILKQLIEDANLNNAANLISGFRTTGIFPYNPQKVYSKIPEYCEDITHDVDKSLLDYLKENRNPNPIRRNANKKMNVQAGKSVSSADINRDENIGLKTQNLTQNVNNEEKHEEVQEKKKPKITILSEIIIKPKQNNNQKAVTTQREEAKAGPSGIKKVLKKQVKQKKSITKRLYDSSSDSDSQCSVQYADSSDYEDMEDYLLKQLIKDQKMQEQEVKDYDTEKRVKTQLESLITNSDGSKEQEIGRQMVNEYEKNRDTWEKQEIETLMSKLGTTGHEINENVKKPQLDSLMTESYERKGQQMERRLEKVTMGDAKEKQDINQTMDRSEMKNRIKGNEIEKQQIEQNINYKGKKEAIIPQPETKNYETKLEYNTKNLYNGQYVLVKFESTRNTNKYYCGQIMQIGEREDILVTFLRYKNGGFFWPTVPDTSIVFRNDIIQFLPDPYKNRRGILYFHVKFEHKLE